MSVMPFGKHKGTPIDCLPDDYLEWLYRLPDLRPFLRAAIDQEVERRRESRQSHRGRSTTSRGRISEAARIITPDIIEAGYRKLAMIHHPDRGGTKEVRK